jgi:hypothetical protein
MMQIFRAGMALLALGVLSTAMVMLPLSASAPVWADDNLGIHGHDHNRLHRWYRTLRQPGTGASCCNEADCRPTSVRTRHDVIEVMVDGEWTVVPPSKILRVTPPDLNTHVCAPRGPWKTKPIHCVVLGFGA